MIPYPWSNRVKHIAKHALVLLCLRTYCAILPCLHSQLRLYCVNEKLILFSNYYRTIKIQPSQCIQSTVLIKKKKVMENSF